MPEPKQVPAPPTEILSVTTRKTDEPPTSPNEELPVEPEAPVVEEPLEQPFTYDEGGEPPPEEPAPEEPVITHEPLKDTQAKLHQTTQELAEMKRIMQAIVAEKELRQPLDFGQRQMPPQEPVSLDPTPEEQAYPHKYTQRVLGQFATALQQENVRQRAQSFAEQNPNWYDLYDVMQEIRREAPHLYQDPGSLSILHKHAQERKSLRETQAKLKQIEEASFQAGAQMGSQGKQRQVVPPRGARQTTGGRAKIPADFHTWSADKMEAWLRANGHWREQ